MAFFDRTYSVFLLLPATGAPGLWQSETWCQFAAALTPFTRTHRGKPAVRSAQYGPGMQLVPFGRLGWDEKSHSRWTHAPGAVSDRRFLSTEAWAPSWTQCAREDRSPDFFVAILNEAALGRAGRHLRFGQRVVCALCDDAGRCGALEATLAGWADTLDAQLFARIRRPWGRSAGGGGFTGAVQDMIHTGLFKPGDPHGHPSLAGSLVEEWEVLHAG